MVNNAEATARNTDSIETLWQNTGDIFDSFAALVGGFMVWQGLGRLARPIEYIATAIAAPLAAMAAVKRKLLVAAGAGSVAIVSVLVTHFEPGRVRGKPYIGPAGVLTVCDGHTGTDINPKRIYMDAECDATRDADLAIADRAGRGRLRAGGTVPRLLRLSPMSRPESQSRSAKRARYLSGA
ncbi:Phage-related lysozyme (muraminidase) [Achromobacter spanius]|uniref:hypothetical protein n=1 Tax=Achromobacter spanius TaxID=217203 RepID=UPI000D9D9F0E|nr:hypothetical protein [Achromobacter spanius]CAB3663066.1 hypothetical protein LMG5911_03073 [Achromobacter spanius]SPT40365.1 Phage-related lysozyme (muraminidase) [Achromobacter denitrificans]VEE58877.1 Phage-related lysozyme (muraminidase) [Achromobacter spanius]